MDGEDGVDEEDDDKEVRVRWVGTERDRNRVQAAVGEDVCVDANGADEEASLHDCHWVYLVLCALGYAEDGYQKGFISGGLVCAAVLLG